jgi:hypothetical protein
MIGRHHRRAVSAVAGLGALVMLAGLAAPASAESYRRDTQCEGSTPSPFTAFAPVGDSRGVTLEKAPRLMSSTGATTAAIGRTAPRFTIEDATWSGLTEDMTVRRQEWRLSFDGLETATVLDTDLGDSYLLCPWDVGGTMYAVEEVTSYDEATQEVVVHARAFSAPVDVVKGRLDVDPDGALVSGHYPGPVVGRATTFSTIARKPDIDGSMKRTTRWTIGSRTVGTSSTYTPTSADWGKTLRATASYSAGGYEPATSTAQGVVKRAPSMSNTTTVLGGGKVRVDVKVVVVGTTRPAGSVRILEDGVQVGTISALSNGTGRVTLSGRRPGVHTYRAAYSGNSLVHPADRYRTVTVR